MIDEKHEGLLEDYDNFFKSAKKICVASSVGHYYKWPESNVFFQFDELRRRQNRNINVVCSILKPLVDSIKPMSWVEEVRLIPEFDYEYGKLSRNRVGLWVKPICELMPGQIEGLKYFLQKYFFDAEKIVQEICAKEESPLFVVSTVDKEKIDLVGEESIILVDDAFLVKFVEKIIKSTNGLFDLEFFISGSEKKSFKFKPFKASQNVKKTQTSLTFNTGIFGKDYDNSSIKLDLSDQSVFEKRRAPAKFRGALRDLIKKIDIDDEVEVEVKPVYKEISFEWRDMKQLELIGIKLVKSKKLL